MTLGEKLKNARKSAGLSQDQLAEKLCVSRAAVAKWETDRGLPDVMNLKAISQLLDISIDALLGDGSHDFSTIKETVDLNQLTVTYTMMWCLSHWKTWTGHYYLVNQGDRQFFVEVTEEFITTTAIAKPITKNKFYIGDRQYIRIRYEIAG